MTAEHHTVGLLSGELTIEQRAAIIKRFRDGKEKVLITTNVSARGNRRWVLPLYFLMWGGGCGGLIIVWLKAILNGK